MLIIFGFRTRPSKVSEGQFFCPRDGGNRPYVHSRYRRWFTLFFIPIFPTGKYTGEFVKCQACGTVYRPDVLGGSQVVTATATPSAPGQHPQFPAPPVSPAQPSWAPPSQPAAQASWPPPPGADAQPAAPASWAPPATPPSTLGNPGQGRNQYLS